MTIIARAVMTLLWSHRDGYTTSAVEMAKQLGCERHYVRQGLDVLVRLWWLVIQDVRYRDKLNAVVNQRYHLAMERAFTPDEVTELSRPVLLDRKRGATTPLTLSRGGEPGSETTSQPGSHTTSQPGSATTTSLDEVLDQELSSRRAPTRAPRQLADELIRLYIPDAGSYPTKELRTLAAVTANLLSQDIEPDLVGLSLHRWHERPDLRPPALHHIASDLIKEFPHLKPQTDTAAQGDTP
ncbi:hypothetical protein ACJH6H_26505 [Mycobacterium sp. SMC-21]|uniref:hypothetical protein n=1 Tax=Mycobacterium sp. SMC-21 TaxID=3381632 RepID=UPI0038776A89